MTPRSKILEIFKAVFVAFFFFFLHFGFTGRICTFILTILKVRYMRLNYEIHSIKKFIIKTEQFFHTSPKLFFPVEDF